MPRTRQPLLACLVPAVFVAACIGLRCLAGWSSAIPFLPAHATGRWIVYPVPPNGYQNPTVELSTEFRSSFVLKTVPPDATLAVCGFKRFSVSINGHDNGPGTRPRASWKQPSEYGVSRLLKPGTNEISVTVFNESGPPALWVLLAAGDAILGSDTNWEASLAGAAWEPARPASLPMAINPGNLMYGGEKPAAALREQSALFLVFAALSLLMMAAGGWWLVRFGQAGSPGQGGPRCRWLWAAVAGLALAYAILWANNLRSLPAAIGFDYAGHVRYIEYVLKHHSLPLATEGWEMYQPPLYYMIAAALLGVLGHSVFDPGGMVALRLLGMSCGIATFTFTFLSLRLMFPGRARPQFFGLLLAALLPANLYLGHYVTNEILAAALAAACVYFCLRLLADPDVSLVAHAVLGLLLGTALLAKSSTLVVPAVVFPALAWNLVAKGVRNPWRWLRYLGMTLLGCLAVAGWHYGRVTAHFGNPLIGNWDSATGFAWWQHPGYRTADYYCSFGKALRDPFYSAYSSFADGLYSTLWGDGFWGGISDVKFRPPWNYDLMAAGYLFALVPTLAILTGGVIALARFIRRPRPEEFLLLGIVALPVLLLIYYSLKIPVYASAKAFYASAAVAPVCVLGALGWDWLAAQARVLRLVLYVAAGIWGMNSYAMFWIRGESSATQILTARNLADQQLHEQALLQLSAVLQSAPGNAAAAALASTELLEVGQVTQAAAMATQATQAAPGDPDCHLALAAVLVRQGKLDEAVLETQRATELAPDSPIAFDKLSERLYALGRRAEAVTACREALRVYPANGGLHYRLASVYSDLGDATNAVVHYRLAVAIDPGSAAALDRLAWVLATEPDPGLRNGAEAVRYATEACRLTGRKDAGALETLAAAYAETGRFAEAVTTAQQAVATARTAGQEAAALSGAKLVELFKAGQPCRVQTGVRAR